MRNSTPFLLAFVLLFFSGIPSMAQSSGAEMADVMRSNGKIYVVVAVMSTILTGLILYLVSLDRRIRKMERNAD